MEKTKISNKVASLRVARTADVIRYLSVRLVSSDEAEFEEIVNDLEIAIREYHRTCAVRNLRTRNVIPWPTEKSVANR